MDYDTQAKDILFFNSVRNSTLAILNSLNNIQLYSKGSNGELLSTSIPITFGNYEKSIRLEDLDQDQLQNTNFNFLPRLVLSFIGMTKNPERTSKKFEKISKKIIDDNGKVLLNYGFNSVAYDFQYNLVLQARGLNQAFRIVEQILPMFRPSYYIEIQEYPLFDRKTQTQLQISDPTFEILDEFESDDTNIINVSFELNLRSNLYMPLQLTGPIEIVKLLTSLWNDQEEKAVTLASEYNWSVDQDTSKIDKLLVEEHYPKA